MTPNFSSQLSQLNYDGQSPAIWKNFIVLEGLDGSGGSTQARLLEQYFCQRLRPCVRSSEPSSGPIGRHIRALLQEQPNSPQIESERQKLPQYFAADRAEHLWAAAGIRAQTQAGTVCISERYLFSSLVYQGQKTPLAKIWQLNHKFPLPQHLIYLDITAEAAERRIAQREAERQSKREIFEKIEFLTRVRQSYLALIRHFAQLAPEMKIHHLNAKQNRKELQRQILQYIA